MPLSEKEFNQSGFGISALFSDIIEDKIMEQTYIKRGEVFTGHEAWVASSNYEYWMVVKSGDDPNTYKDGDKRWNAVLMDKDCTIEEYFEYLVDSGNKDYLDSK